MAWGSHYLRCPNQEVNLLLPLISTNDRNNHNPLPLSSSSSNSDITSVVCPSLAYANTLFFRSAYNIQVIVDDNEHEEKLIGRFRREVMRAGVIQECTRRRFFDNTQDKDKRKTREAAKRNRRRRGPPPSRNFGQDKQETSKNKRNDDDGDNWELPDGGCGSFSILGNITVKSCFMVLDRATTLLFHGFDLSVACRISEGDITY
nr:PREDICTED: uncharacterized protein LOC107831989 [Nicotiana tabacum]